MLIIGCGIAGATAALRLATNSQRQITVVTRSRDPHESNTRYAQGGIVGRGIDDKPELLEADILEAGAGVSLPEAARIRAMKDQPCHEFWKRRRARICSGSEGHPLCTTKRLTHAGASSVAMRPAKPHG